MKSFKLFYEDIRILIINVVKLYSINLNINKKERKMITTLTIIGFILVLGAIVSFAVKLFNQPPFNISNKICVLIVIVSKWI